MNMRLGNQRKPKSPKVNRPKELNGKQLVENMEAENWRIAFSSFIQKVVSIVGDKYIPVHWVDSSNIAATDGETIMLGTQFYNENIVPYIKAKNFSDAGTAVGTLKGLALHELAHIFWTPRNHEPCGRYFLVTALIQDEKDLELQASMNSLPKPFSVYRAFNLLEDARIELRFLTKYAPAKPYFIAACSSVFFGANGFVKTTDISSDEYGLSDVTADRMTWIMLYGRKYIPKSIVNTLEIAYEQMIQEAIAKGKTPLATANVKKIIDTFITLDFKDELQARHAVALSVRLAMHLTALQDVPDITQPPEDGDGGGGNGGGQADSEVPEDDSHGNTTEKGKSINKKKDITEEELKETLDELNEDSEESDDSDGSGGSGDSEESEEEADDSDGSDGSGDSSDTDKSSENGKSESESESGSEQKPTQGSKGSSTSDDDSDDDSDSEPFDMGAFEDAIEQMVEKLVSALNEEFQSDIKAIANIKEHGARPSLVPDIKNCSMGVVDQKMKMGASALTKAVQKIWSETEPAWEDGYTHGRLNMNNAMNSTANGGTNLAVFDSWVDNGEANDFEVVVLVDQSSSMRDSANYVLDPVTRRQTRGASLMEVTSKALWQIRSMCETLSIPLTVYGYDDKPRLLFNQGSKPSKSTFISLNSSGGTNPAGAIMWAYQTMKASSATHKLLFTLTDGSWNSGGRIKSDDANLAGTQLSGFELYKAPIIAMKEQFNVHSFLCTIGDFANLSHKEAYDRLSQFYGHTHYIPVKQLNDFPSDVANVISKLSLNK